MKTWIDLSTVEMPENIAGMQKDERGYPIPHTVHWIDGKPDFRVIDPDKWIEAARECLCGICGKKIESKIAFVGGPRSIENRLFVDLGMHKECAEYALQVCPFMAAPKFGYLECKGLKKGELAVISAASNTRPTKFGLGLTSGYGVGRLVSGDIVIQATPFESVEWWVNGEKQS